MKLARPPIPPKKEQSERGRGGRRGLGGGIPPRPSRSEAFPPSWYQDIKAKQFSIPFKKNLAGGNAERSYSSIFRSKKVRASFSNCDKEHH